MFIFNHMHLVRLQRTDSCFFLCRNNAFYRRFDGTLYTFYVHFVQHAFNAADIKQKN